MRRGGSVRFVAYVYGDRELFRRMRTGSGLHLGELCRKLQRHTLR
jgi:hypothetical protein